MLLFITLFTLIFVCTSFFGSSQFHIHNSFLGYLFFQLDYILQYFLLFVLAFCGGLSFILLPLLKRTKDIPQIATYAFFQGLGALFVSLFSAYVLLLFIACIELNCFAIIMNLHPSLLGVTMNTNQIVKQLQKATLPPTIIASDKNSQQEVIAIAQATGGNTNFYSKELLPTIPNFLIVPITKTSSSLVLIDNDLILTSIYQNDMQKISPLIGHLFLQEYFPNRVIKSYPKVSVMTTQEYQKFRTADAKDKLTKVTQDLQNMEQGISSISAQITLDQQNIATNDATQKDSMKERDKEYDTCLSTGTYDKNVFKPTYTKDYCQTILDKWNTTLTSQATQQSEINTKLTSDQQVLATYQYYDNFFKAEKTLLAITSGNIPSELGVFEPPGSIKIVIATANSHTVGDYFETLVHEYLHYASFVQGKRFDNSFFEEGLTEYFARQTIKDNLDIDTNTGYPLAAKIIAEMTKKIAEVDLADIYFTKDETRLEHSLDLVYGDDFYKNNFVQFESLMYTTDPDQALKIANDIMKKIGGSPLKKEDVYSSESSL